MPKLRWLPGNFDNLQLDIVGFLAILGEASIKANAQVSFLSPISLLPRLIPAPQALIRTSRPESLKPSTGKVFGARGGGIRDHINHLANLVHSGKPLPDYAVRCERITKPDLRAQPSATLFGPLAWVGLLGAVMSICLLIFALIRSDGFALIATLLLSLLSSIIGIGSQWSLKLMERKQTRRVPDDFHIIQYPHGAFLIVKCDENVRRELYWHPEKCNYTYGDTTYRILSLFGTTMLMFGVICLANSTLALQVAFAAAYMILNAAYWVVAALPGRWHWDLSCYEITSEEYEGEEVQQNFTQALWKAIAITGSAEWVQSGRVAPINEGWKRWVETAGEKVRKAKENQSTGVLADSGYGYIAGISNKISLPQWDADQALTDFLNSDEGEKNV